MPTTPCPPERRSGWRPAWKVGDIFRTFGPAFIRAHDLCGAVLKVLHDAMRCRTPALGGHVYVCDQCGQEHVSYNSCGNRHCPTCQHERQEAWIAQRAERILPTHHFHVVFTLPADLRPVAFANPETVLALLFAAASQTLLTLGRQRLGGTLALTAVLHTWTRSMLYHPHLHFVVSGGALSPQGEWKAASKKFLFPVAVMRNLFRGRLLAGLEKTRRDGKLRFAGSSAHLADPDAWARLRDRLYRVPWVVHTKRPFGGAQNVIAYLGRYTHRVAISSSRLVAVSDTAITFRTRGEGTVTVAPHEFIRRFLLHVLPREFRKIRHYGLYSSSGVKSLLPTARACLEPHAPVAATPAPAEELDEAKPLRTCPACKVGHLVWSRSLDPVPCSWPGPAPPFCDSS